MSREYLKIGGGEGVKIIKTFEDLGCCPRYVPCSVCLCFYFRAQNRSLLSLTQDLCFPWDQEELDEDKNCWRHRGVGKGQLLLLQAQTELSLPSDYPGSQGLNTPGNELIFEGLILQMKGFREITALCCSFHAPASNRGGSITGLINSQQRTS